MYVTESEARAAGLSYSEEAINERDPSYRLPCDESVADYLTVESMPQSVRAEMAARLICAGMSPERALAVVQL